MATDHLHRGNRCRQGYSRRGHGQRRRSRPVVPSWGGDESRQGSHRQGPWIAGLVRSRGLGQGEATASTLTSLDPHGRRLLSPRSAGNGTPDCREPSIAWRCSQPSLTVGAPALRRMLHGQPCRQTGTLQSPWRQSVGARPARRQSRTSRVTVPCRRSACCQALLAQGRPASVHPSTSSA